MTNSDLKRLEEENNSLKKELEEIKYKNKIKELEGKVQSLEETLSDQEKRQDTNVLSQSELRKAKINSSITTTEGRFNRGQFFAWFVIGIIISAIGGAIIDTGSTPPVSGGTMLFGYGILGVSIIILLFAYIKRLHDLNTSGIAVILFFIPIVNLLLILYLLLAPGTEGENKYDPKLK